MFSFWKISEKDLMKIGIAVPASVSDAELRLSFGVLFCWELCGLYPRFCKFCTICLCLIPVSLLK